MARRRGSKKSKSLSSSGENPLFSTRSVPRRDITRYSPDALASSPPDNFEWFSNRSFIRLIDALESDGGSARLDRRSRAFSLPYTLKAPFPIKFCLDRKIRRGVLFAKRVAGRRGSSKKRHYRRSASSYYTC